MIFIGVDIGKQKHCAIAVDERGKELSHAFSFENDESGFCSFLAFLSKFSSSDDICVAMEATGHYWLNLYSFLLHKNIEPHVFNPIQTDAVRRMSIRKTKTDTVDCKYIADVVRIGNYSDVRIQSSELQELRQLCRFRYGLTDELSRLKNQITGVLDRIFPEYASLFSDVFGVASMALLKKYPTPGDIRKVPTSRLSDLLRKHSRGALGEAKAKEIKEACLHSVGITSASPAFVFQLQLLLSHIDFLHLQVKETETKIEELYNRSGCFLHTIQGIGVISAAVILSEIGDIRNFDSLRKITAFAGIDPSVSQSGNFESSRNKMSKRGSPYLRRAIWNCAVVAARQNPKLHEFFEKKRSEGKPYMTSIGAVSHKLCSFIFATLRDQKPFVIS